MSSVWCWRPVRARRVLSGSQRSGVVRDSRRIRASLDRRPERRQPRIVAADLPVAIDLHHAAELAVAAGAEVPRARADGQLQAEGHAAVGQQVVAVVGLAHGAFQLGEEEGQRLGVVPDMGAASFAAAGRGVTPFPAVEGAVLQAQHGGRFEDGDVGRDGVQRGRRQIGGEERVLEAACLAGQTIPVLQRIATAGR